MHMYIHRTTCTYALSTQRLTSFLIQLAHGACARQKQTLWGEWYLRPRLRVQTQHTMCIHTYAYVRQLQKKNIALPQYPNNDGQNCN